jgi:hypothetical protein
MAVVMTAQQVAQAFANRGVRTTSVCPYFSDSSFVLIPRSDLGLFGREFFQYMTAGDLYKWADGHDCDNKAIEAYAFAQRKHKYALHNTDMFADLRKANPGAAFFFMDYRIDDNGFHRVNCFISEQKGILEAWEPQTTQIITLSTNEWASVVFAHC